MALLHLWKVGLPQLTLLLQKKNKTKNEFIFFLHHKILFSHFGKNTDGHNVRSGKWNCSFYKSRELLLLLYMPRELKLSTRRRRQRRSQSYLEFHMKIGFFCFWHLFSTIAGGGISPTVLAFHLSNWALEKNQH